MASVTATMFSLFVSRSVCTHLSYEPTKYISDRPSLTHIRDVSATDHHKLTYEMYQRPTITNSHTRCISDRPSLTHIRDVSATDHH